MNPLSPQFLKEVEDRTTERAMTIIEALMDRLIVDGTTYGDIEFKTDADFAMFYLDLQQRGILPYLHVVNEKLSNQWRDRFERTAGRLMGVR